MLQFEITLAISTSVFTYAMYNVQLNGNTKISIDNFIFNTFYLQ